MRKKASIMAVALTALAISLSGCANTKAAPTSPSTGQATETTLAVAPVSNTTAAAGTNAQITATSTATGAITESQALEIAYQHAGVKPEEVLRHRVKLDIDDGVQEYDVNFFTQGNEYDYDISAATGEIRSFDHEVEDTSWMGGSSAAPAASVTIEDAKRLALDRVKGATDSNIQIKTDLEDGRTVYEGKIVFDNMEYDFEIDAASGAFLEWDVESVFD